MVDDEQTRVDAREQVRSGARSDGVSGCVAGAIVASVDMVPLWYGGDTDERKSADRMEREPPYFVLRPATTRVQTG